MYVLMMDRFNILVILVIVVGGLAGTVYAVPTIFTDNTKVNEGTFTVQRDLNWAAITVQTNTQHAVMQFVDIDDNQIWQVLMRPGGDRLEIRDQTNGRTSIAITEDTGFVGINTIAPSEQLDVNGNLHVSGDITTTGDICIGTCP